MLIELKAGHRLGLGRRNAEGKPEYEEGLTEIPDDLWPSVRRSLDRGIYSFPAPEWERKDKQLIEAAEKAQARLSAEAAAKEARLAADRAAEEARLAAEAAASVAKVLADKAKALGVGSTSPK